MPIWKLKYDTIVNSHELALKQLLKNRGVGSIEELEKYNDLNDAHLKEYFGADFVTSIEKSVKLIKSYIKKDLPIVIHGDYDADGVTSTALIWQAIYEKLGYKNVFPYIPSRFDEGYGLSFDSLKNIDEKYFKEKKGLLITVDCGITATDQIEQAKKNGIQVLLTDHHQIPNPDLLVWTDKLCGVGIAYFIVSRLVKNNDFGLDLVAIGTIADIQPLTNINRSLVKKGLAQINTNPRIGIKKLLNIAGFEKEVKAKDIGWVLAPRINASGRLENAFDALRLLCTKDVQVAEKLSLSLDLINKERQQKTELMVKTAELQVTNELVSFIVGENFHEGIVGLIAGRLTQKYYKPAIVLQVENNIAKGSARSIPEIDIIKLLRKFEGEFINLGGHSAAAGFSVSYEKVEKLKIYINDYLKEINNGILYKRNLEIEFEIDLAIFNEKLFNLTQMLEPCGVSNPSPLFLIKNLRIVDFKKIGRDFSHISFNLTNGKDFIKGVGFGMAQLSDSLNYDDNVDIVCSLTQNIWNGNTNYEFQLKDLKKSSSQS